MTWHLATNHTLPHLTSPPLLHLASQETTCHHTLSHRITSHHITSQTPKRDSSSCVPSPTRGIGSMGDSSNRSLAYGTYTFWNPAIKVLVQSIAATWLLWGTWLEEQTLAIALHGVARSALYVTSNPHVSRRTCTIDLEGILSLPHNP